jgi:hypothetical protein
MHLHIHFSIFRAYHIWRNGLHRLFGLLLYNLCLQRLNGNHSLLNYGFDIDFLFFFNNFLGTNWSVLFDFMRISEYIELTGTVTEASRGHFCRGRHRNDLLNGLHGNFN